MSTQKDNSQIIRSKRLLQHALIELLQEKPFKKITIADIALKAGYSRTTFYAHFNYKEDILNEYIDELIERILYDSFGEISTFPPSREEQFKMTERLVDHWEENAESFKSLHTAGLENLVTNKFKEKLKQLNLEKISPILYLTSEPNLVDYFYVFSSGLLVGILQFWISNDMVTPKEEIALILSFFDTPEFYLFLQKKDL